MLNSKRSIVSFLVPCLLIAALAGVAVGFKTDPYMKSTRTQLMKARACLIAAGAHKGGHPLNALTHTSAAIDEVTLGMKSNHHHHAQVAAGELYATTTFAGSTVAGSNMTKALIHLKQAKENLGAAVPDRGGHHGKAMELITKAIEEVEKANAATN